MPNILPSIKQFKAINRHNGNTGRIDSTIIIKDAKIGPKYPIANIKDSIYSYKLFKNSFILITKSIIHYK